MDCGPWTVAHGSIAEGGGAAALLLLSRSHGPWAMNIRPWLNFVMNQTLIFFILSTWFVAHGSIHGPWAMKISPIINLVMHQTLSNYLWIHILLNQLINWQGSWPMVLSPMEADSLLLSPRNHGPWSMNIQPLNNLIMNPSLTSYSFIGISISQSIDELTWIVAHC